MFASTRKYFYNSEEQGIRIVSVRFSDVANSPLEISRYHSARYVEFFILPPLPDKEIRSSAEYESSSCEKLDRINRDKNKDSSVDTGM